MRIAIRPLVASLLVGAAIGFAGEPTPAPVALGTAHPGLVEALDPAGRWIVACQARADTNQDGRIETALHFEGFTYGDDLLPYLVVGGGAGIPIDRLLAVDPRSRYVVGAPQGRVTLFDTRTGTATDLTPAPAHEGEPTSVVGRPSFDDAGRLCLTVRAHGTGGPSVLRLVVRVLESGAETSVDPGHGLFVDAELSGDGAWIDMKVVTQDTDGNGKLEAPTRPTSIYQGGCAGPASAGFFGPRTGDRPIHRLLAVDGSWRRDLPGLIGLVGHRWVRRLEDGSLVLEAPTGRSATIAAASLKAKVLAIDDASERVLFASSVGSDERAVLAAGPEDVRDTGLRLPGDEELREAARRRTARITRVGPWGTPVAFDWQKGVEVPLKGTLLACEGSHALVLRESRLFVLDVDAGTAVALPGETDHDVYGDAWRAGALAAAGGFVVDLAQAKVVGTYPYPLEIPYPTTSTAVWGLRDDGALLRSAAPSARDRRSDGSLRAGGSALPPGPFRWEPPSPPR